MWLINNIILNLAGIFIYFGGSKPQIISDSVFL